MIFKIIFICLPCIFCLQWTNDINVCYTWHLSGCVNNEYKPGQFQRLMEQMIYLPIFQNKKSHTDNFKVFEYSFLSKYWADNALRNNIYSHSNLVDWHCTNYCKYCNSQITFNISTATPNTSTLTNERMVHFVVQSHSYWNVECWPHWLFYWQVGFFQVVKMIICLHLIYLDNGS